MTRNYDNSLTALTLADPVLAEEAGQQLERFGCPADAAGVALLVEDTVFCLSVSTSLGHAVVRGYVELLKNKLPVEQIKIFSDTIRRNAAEHPTFAGIIASGLVPVLLYGDDALRSLFFKAAGLMKEKWLYALAAEPLDILVAIVDRDDAAAGAAWLSLLCDVFAHDLTYNQFRRFTSRFPRAVLSFPASRRAWRIEQLRRVAQRDFNLACLFIDALGREPALLSPDGLRRFVDEGLSRYDQNPDRGRKFLGLEARSAHETCARLQTAVVFAQMRSRLSHYLQARCGRTIPLKPLSGLPAPFADKGAEPVRVCCDGKAIYLPDEISRSADPFENRMLYKTLAWVAAALLEFDSYSFDLDKVGQYIQIDGIPDNEDTTGLTDLERFCRLMPQPAQARDLFTIFEYGRLRTLLEKAYPAGVDRYYPVLRREAARLFAADPETGIMEALYAVLALGDESEGSRLLRKGPVETSVQAIIDIFNARVAGSPVPEAVALGVYHVRETIGPDGFAGIGRSGRTLSTPFDLRLWPELFAYSFSGQLRRAASLKERIIMSGAMAYKSDIIKRLMDQSGILSPDDIKDFIQTGDVSSTGEQAGLPESLMPDIDISAIMGSGGGAGVGQGQSPDDFSGNTCRYREWDHATGDYLDNHVLVRERPGDTGEADFYGRVLDRNRGLVKKIRHAFELLKPEGISRLRQWREGEEFDYGRLLEYVVDKRSGRTPSERIYIKRLKQRRDVAVQLLIDFSRSTANRIPGSETATVLDIEKEAAVLFCEALTVVGDPYAISGFSGTGRLGVDYYRLKGFNEPMTPVVAGRIEAVTPRRNTRMGAAVRHAVTVFDTVPAGTRLLILISDGFPNDLDYKREYALEDTRRALLEARAGGIAVHSITVNIAGDVVLDDLYGRVGHSVISDVRELPGKLLRIYGRLTR